MRQRIAMRMQQRLRIALALALIAARSLAAAASGQQASAIPPPSAHYVVMIGLSGFRWDYATRDGAKNLLALGKSGASAPDGMLPAFPSSTWPNAWTLVTGLYPGHHGIVADNFFDPVKKLRIAWDDTKPVADVVSIDSSRYGGVPLWALAEKQGIRTACIDWPGCTARVGGAQPLMMSQEKRIATPDEKVRQIAAWLRLPETERPHLVTAYFSEVNDAGLRFGPDAAETRIAVHSVDAMVGRLRAALDATHLPIDLVVVSDHGMAKTDGAWITLDTLADLTGFESAGALLYGKSNADSERVYNQLKKASATFVSYRLKDLPPDLHLDNNARAGDPVVVATGPYAIRAHVPVAAQADAVPPKGIDGLNVQTSPEMKGIFFAAGPDIVEGKTVGPFENVNLYPWIAHLLGLTTSKNDGSLNLLSGTLRDNGGDTDQ